MTQKGQPPQPALPANSSIAYTETVSKPVATVIRDSHVGRLLVRVIKKQTPPTFNLDRRGFIEHVNISKWVRFV